MAKTYNPLGMGGCLLAANDKSGTRYGDWRVANNKPAQRRAIKLNPTQAEAEAVPELERWADTSHAALNEILAQRGFTSRFSPFRKDAFGSLSILDLKVAWQVPGDRCKVKDKATGKSYDGFCLSGSGCGVTVIHGKADASPIARIVTKNGDIVWIQKTDEEPKDDIAAAEAAEKMVRLARKKAGEKGVLTAPLVSFKESRNLDWLAGLSVPGKIEMEGGFQETKFGMNEHGARAKVATGGVFYATSVQKPPFEFVVDGPAIIAIERPGIAGPIFSAYITPNDWKDPGNLAEM